jgi:arginine decarboxylase
VVPAVSARFDRWRDLSKAAQAWAAKGGGPNGAALKTECARTLEQLKPLESLQAFPGLRLLRSLDERVNSGDAQGTLRLVQRVSSALMSRG